MNGPTKQNNSEFLPIFLWTLKKILPKPTTSWMLHLKEKPRHSDKPRKIYFIAKRIKTVNKRKSAPEFVSCLLIS